MILQTTGIRLIGIIVFFAIAILSYFLLKKIESDITGDQKKHLKNILKFSVAYTILNILFFTFIYWVVSDEKFVSITLQHASSLRIIAPTFLLPILIQYYAFQKIHKSRKLDYEDMKISIDFLLIISVIGLFLIDDIKLGEEVLAGESNPFPLKIFISGISIYFAMSKLLVDYLVRISVTVK